MSHIDSFKHEIVGLFGYLPVYHPLEDIEGDFFCTKKQLMLGGGSGEHPALIGEFVFFSMPDLASEIMNQLCEPYKYFRHMYYNNIMVIPPNFPVYANGGNAFCFSRKNKYS